MKRILFSIAIVLVAFAANAQSTLKPSIKNDKSSFVQTAKTSTTSFQLNATDTEIDQLTKKAATMSTIKLSAKKLKGNNYECVLVIMDKTDARYVQRIFGFLGFMEFTIGDSANKKLDELAQNLTSLK